MAIKNNIRIRLSIREAATLRISLKGRMNHLALGLKGTDKTSELYKHQSEMLGHMTKTYNRLHEATYGKEA